MGECICGYTFCTSCMQPYHGAYDCGLTDEQRLLMLEVYQRQESEKQAELEAIEAQRKKRQEEIEASEIYVRENSKKCPTCHFDVEKIDGCNYMVCTKCRRSFCWICLKSGITHFGHFRETDCELWE